MSTALNSNGGTKRLRYQSLSDSLQKANVDVVHRILPDIDLDAKVLGDSSMVIRCHLLNQLEECRQLDLFPSFRRFVILINYTDTLLRIHTNSCLFRFYHVLRPFVQSLPEVLHFQENIIALLVEQVKSCDSMVLPTYTKLITALARYVTS